MAGKDMPPKTGQAVARAGDAAAGAPRLTPQQSAARGRLARDQVPRESHAAWMPRPDRPDPIALLQAQALPRIPELVQVRFGRMVASPFAFYRGAAAIMASDLAGMPQSGVVVQLCGDAHLGNFGAFASSEHDLVLDISDFDETLPGPWEWDVKRLATSIEVLGRERSFGDDACRALVVASIAEYRQAMREFAEMGNLDLWHLRLDLGAAQRRWSQELPVGELKHLDKHHPEGRTFDNMRAIERSTRRGGGRLAIAGHPPVVIPIEDLMEDADRRAAEEAMRRCIGTYAGRLLHDRRHLIERYEYRHMARKVVGVGSIGLDTWIVLLTGRDDEDTVFLQVREAQASVLEPYLGRSQLRSHGQRVVAGQRQLQAACDVFLGWTRAAGMRGVTPRSYTLRQLWEWKSPAHVESMSPRKLLIHTRMCGWILARAHARVGDPIAIANYLGKGPAFEQAVADFAAVYARQNERDYWALRKAVENGRVKAKADA